MIDLSYLTEEEQGMVLAVLKRDAKLKNLEEQRIKRLHKTEKDSSRLKYLTGEWFYETKYHRHRDRIHGSDIIRASMGQRKPFTISELRWEEKPSLVNSERRDVFIPPELIGLIEDPSTQSRNDRVDDHKSPEAQQERQRSKIKPRQNPFNIMRSHWDADRRINGVKEAEQAPTEEPLLAAKSSTPYNAIQNTDNTETHVCTKCTGKPVPINRLLLNSSTDSHLDSTDGDSSVIQDVTPTPRGIFKAHDCFSCSSTGSILDSSICPISLEIPISPPLFPCTMQSDSEWLDRKQVHFSLIVRPMGTEKGEHSVLDEDWSHLVDEDKEPNRSDNMNNDNHELYAEPQSTQVSNFHSTAEVTGKAIQLDTECQTRKVTEEEGHSISKVLEWFGRGSQDAVLKSPVESEKNQEEPKDHGTLDAKSVDLSPPVVQPKTKSSPKPFRGLFAVFSKTEKKDKSLEVLVPDEEVRSQDKESSTSECQTTCTMRTEADDNVDLQEESKMTEILQVLSKAVDGNKKGSAVCEYGSQKLDQSEVSPGRLANLKSFWERGNGGPKILSFKKRDLVPESETSQLNENDNALDLRFNLSESKPSDPIPNPVRASEYPVDIESTTGMMYALSSNEDAKLSDLDSSKISESPNSKQQSNMVKTDLRLLSPNNDITSGRDMQEEALAESLSKEISDLKEEISTFKISLSPQKNKVSINDLKSFWEKEKSGLRVIVGSPTCASNTKDSSRESSPQCSSIELYKSQSDVRSDSPVLSSLDRMSLSLNTDVDLLATQEEKKHSPSRVPEQDHQYFTGSVPYTSQNTSNFKPQSISDKHLKLSLPSSLRSLSAKGQNEIQLATDIYQSKDQGQTRAPCPLRQFKVPSRDSYPNKESRKDGTFVIEINQVDKSPCTVKGKPVQTHKEIPSNSLHLIEKMGQANWSKGNSMSPPQDISEVLTNLLDSGPLHSSAVWSQGLATGQLCMSVKHRKTFEEDIDLEPIMSSEQKLSTDSHSNAHQVRSYIPLSLQHYLVLSKQTVLNERERLEVQAGEAFKQVNQGRISNESSSSRHSQPDSEEITFDSSGSSTSEAWSFSYTSSACDSAEHSPVQAALERANARPISISKSLEDLPSTPSSSTVASNTNTSFSDPEQMKMMSLSVPTFIHQEMDYRNGDCASVGSFQFDRPRACNASPAFNICSEVTSMSSVTGSVMSINSGEFGNVVVKGTIQFAINYLEKLGEFHIFVVQCKDLAVADPKRNRSDPYVKCYLLPDKAKFGKRKTCVRKKTLDPTYNEILRFKIPMETLKTQKLNTSVWHNDTFGHNSCLGEVEIDLAEWDFSTTQMNDYVLKGRVQVPRSPSHFACSEEMRAEMRVALRFLQQTSHTHKNKVNGEVQIWVKECKNLPISRGVSINPFVKCTVLPDTSRKSRQKTRVVKRASNPEFNHTLVYDGFRPEDLKEACVELTVWDHERLHNHFIGGIRLGPGTGKSYGADVDWMDSNSAEATLWEKMMQSHNEWVEGVLPLRMLLMAKKS